MNIQWDTYHTKNIKSNYLFRYMKSERLFEFLRAGGLSMSRMDQFKDKLEGIATGNIVSLGLLPLLKKEVKWNPSLSKEQIESSKRTATAHLLNARRQLNNIQSCNYVSCWYMADRESVAMWDLYAGMEDGIAIQVERKKLQQMVQSRLAKNQLPNNTHRVIAGKVVYHDFRRVHLKQNAHLMKYLSFRKDISFDHEKEYRFVLSVSAPNNTLKRYEYSLDPMDSLKIKIIANPRMQENVFTRIQEQIKGISSDLILHESEIKPWYEFMKMEI